MKTTILSIFVLAMVNTVVYSQNNNSIHFNKWSIEANVGTTKPYRNFSSGYGSSTPGALSGDIGARYMFNEYFGLRPEFGYNNFTNSTNSQDFNTDYYRLNVQMYSNIGRVLRFENWTNSFNLLLHAGPGVGHFNYENNPSASDNVLNFIGGITGQYKLSDKLSLNMDLSSLVNFRHNVAFDGVTHNDKGTSFIANGTVGISYNLGGKSDYADWYVEDDIPFSVVEQRIISADSSALEANKVSDKNQKEIEQIKASILSLESQLSEISSNQNAIQLAEEKTGQERIAELLEGEYSNIYFDFNSTWVDKSALNSVNILMNYLKKNPGAKVMLKGYADEQGTKEYNILLSKKRAEAIKELLVSTGIEEKRLSTKGYGVDTSINGGKLSNQLARRVSISLNEDAFAYDAASNKIIATGNQNNESYKKGEFKPSYLDVDCKPVHFVEGKSYLTQFSKGRLDKLVKTLISNPDYYLNMYAYTDGQTIVEKNKGLSESRIQSVTDHLLNNGVDASQIIKKEVKGASNPIAAMDTEKGRLLNRRIEFELFELDESQAMRIAE